jgi:hypothetical protein
MNARAAASGCPLLHDFEAAFDRHFVRGEPLPPPLDPEQLELEHGDQVAGPDGEPFFGDGFLEEEGRP